MVWLVLASVVLGGCGVGSEWSKGDQGKTEWQISDGLCPGFGCAMDTPVATSALVTLTMRGVDPTGDSAMVSPSLALLSFTPSTGSGDPYATISLRASTAADGYVALVDGAGTEIDRAHLTVRSPTTLVCGTVPSGSSLDWQMANLVVATSVDVSLSTSGVQVACRASDASGPMLTVGAIHWRVATGTSVLEVHEDIDVAPFVEADGARIYFRGATTGNASVHVTIGSAAADLNVHVIP